MATEHDSSDTEQAPTEQASAETTELPPAKAAEVVQAWSIDVPAEVDSDSPRRGRLISVGLVGLVVVVAGALIFLVATLFSSHRSKPVEPKAQPTTTVPVAPPPPPAVTATATPPPTVTVTAEPPPPPLSATDQQFLTVLRNHGLSYPDPAYAISHAHATCEFMATHRGQSADDYVVRTTIWTGGLESVEFAEYSARNYCPQFGSE